MQVLMLGKGWFPSQLGGLNRYYRSVLEQLPEARGLVVGPADGADERVIAVSNHSAPLPARLVATARTAWREQPKADLVDAHFALYATLPSLMCRVRGTPLIVHFHGPWADENVAIGDVSRWREFARRRLERSVYVRAQRVITLTGAFRRVLVERYGVSPWNATVLAPGVDLERFSPGDRSAARARFGLPADAFVVCCVRRLVPRMGLDVLLEAWTRLLAADPGARLLIAGNGVLKDELQQQIASRSLEHSVTLLGRVGEPDLPVLYRAADVNVVPSIGFEGFGLVVLEAAASGTPSLATAVGGLPEAVAGLGSDLVVAPGNPGALAARLELARRGELPGRKDTRAWAETQGWERVADAHRRLFASVIAGRGNRSDKLRVVYLDHVSQMSGGELALLRLIKSLAGVDAHVILAEEGPLVDRLLREGISAEVLPMRGRTLLLRKDTVRPGTLPIRAVSDTIGYSLRLAWRLRRLRPDVVHTNSLKAGIYGSVAARLAGRPIVWHVRDRIDTDYLPRLGVLLIRTLTRHLPHVVVSNSASTRRTLASRRKSLVIPSVVEPIGSRVNATRPADRPFVVGMVGRLAPWKGQDVFLRAFARAFARGDQRALIVGAPLFGDEEVKYAEGLRLLAEELGISDRVEFRGHREDVAGELRAMDVLVHASIIPEPFGQTVVEGMSARLAVLASRGGGPEEVITDGADGLLYPPGDVASLAHLLVRLEKQPGWRAQLGEAARRRSAEFSPAMVADRMMQAYALARADSGLSSP